MSTTFTYNEISRQINPEDVHEVLGRHMLTDGYRFVWDHRNSQGSYLVDAVSGRHFLDMFSFFASSPLGYNHPALQDATFREKIAEIALLNPSNSEVYTVEMAEFVQTFERVGLPAEFPHLFMIAGGAPAVENALKVAFDWKVRKNFARGATTEKGHKIIHFKEAFHGRLGYSVSLTNTADPRKYQYFPRHLDWPRIDNPKLRFPLTEENLAAAAEAEALALAQIEESFQKFPDEIAAIIIEPIQAEGGDNHFRPEFFRALRHLADKHEAMLIFDEIQTGVGMSGTFWAWQGLGVQPDIFVFGKKMQVCGLACSRRVDEVAQNVFVEHSRINSTWGGNLVDMVRGQRYLEIIEREGLVENARKQGEYLLEQLATLETRLGAFDNLRGRGLMIAFDFPHPTRRDEIIRAAYDHNLLLLPCGTRSIRLRPHLDIGREALDKFLTILEKVLCL